MRYPLHILIVEDLTDAAESLALLLELKGYRATAVGNGDEALAAARTIRPDVVLLDIGLPGMRGDEVSRRLRAEPWGKSTLIVALTGWGRRQDEARAREAHIDHYLVKPVDLPTLEHVFAHADRPGERVSAAHGE